VVVAEVEKHRNLPGGGVWWDVAPAEASSEPITQKLRTEYERDRAQLQRFHY
jgi:3D-(3,5/4)-trihydroxycyclohexane-1,2-dione acylhydrolase (decyclizing)